MSPDAPSSKSPSRSSIPEKRPRIDEKKIDVPVLVVAGAEDRITPASVNRKIAHKYKNVATYMEFPHHAHWIFGEPGWETVAGHIHFWLNQGEAV